MKSKEKVLEEIDSLKNIRAMFIVTSREHDSFTFAIKELEWVLEK